MGGNLGHAETGSVAQLWVWAIMETGSGGREQQCGGGGHVN